MPHCGKRPPGAQGEPPEARIQGKVRSGSGGGTVPGSPPGSAGKARSVRLIEEWEDLDAPEYPLYPCLPSVVEDLVEGTHGATTE
jgi:hypothetical protein